MKRTIAQIAVSNMPSEDGRNMLVVLATDGSLWWLVSGDSLNGAKDKWGRLPGLPDETEEEVKDRNDHRKKMAAEVQDKIDKLHKEK